MKICQLNGVYEQGVDFTDLQAFIDANLNNSILTKSVGIRVNTPCDQDAIIRFSNIISNAKYTTESMQQQSPIINLAYSEMVAREIRFSNIQSVFQIINEGDENTVLCGVVDTRNSCNFINFVGSGSVYDEENNDHINLTGNGIFNFNSVYDYSNIYVSSGGIMFFRQGTVINMLGSSAMISTDGKLTVQGEVNCTAFNVYDELRISSSAVLNIAEGGYSASNRSLVVDGRQFVSENLSTFAKANGSTGMRVCPLEGGHYYQGNDFDSLQDFVEKNLNNTILTQFITIFIGEPNYEDVVFSNIINSVPSSNGVTNGITIVYTERVANDLRFVNVQCVVTFISQGDGSNDLCANLFTDNEVNRLDFSLTVYDGATWLGGSGVFGIEGNITNNGGNINFTSTTVINVGGDIYNESGKITMFGEVNCGTFSTSQDLRIASGALLNCVIFDVANGALVVDENKTHDTYQRPLNYSTSPQKTGRTDVRGNYTSVITITGTAGNAQNTWNNVGNPIPDFGYAVCLLEGNSSNAGGSFIPHGTATPTIAFSLTMNGGQLQEEHTGSSISNQPVQATIEYVAYEDNIN